MPSREEKVAWASDQRTKAEFFHQKLHEWGLLQIAYELESIKGEKLNWDKSSLGISEGAWNKVIHRGIIPLRVFAHPEVLVENPKRVSYYRMLSMVSQKSMNRVDLTIGKHETGLAPLERERALSLAKHFNSLISALIEFDETLDPREFDLWRGMTAGSQAQGSWQNAKGNIPEVLIKDIIKKRLIEKGLVKTQTADAKKFTLRDNRIFEFADEPDIGVYANGKIQIAIEIKGGIDPAGVLERLGAALKSLRRAKKENTSSLTILIAQGISLTKQARKDLQSNKAIIDKMYVLEDIVNQRAVLKEFFRRIEI